MKKLIAFLVLGLLLIPLANGQVKVGVKGGLNLADIHGYGTPKGLSPRIAFHTGIISEVAIKGKIFIRPELLYSLKGLHFPARPYTGKGNVSLHYINLPLLVGYRVIEKGSVMFGPELGYLLQAYTRFDDKHIPLPFYEKWDKGLNLGISYSFNARLGTEMRYYHGFKGLLKSTLVDEHGTPIREVKDGSNRVLQVSLFYFLTK